MIKIKDKNGKINDTLVVINENNIEALDISSPDPCEEYIKEETKENLKEAMMVLSEKQIYLINQIYYENKSIGDVAKEMGISRSAIKAKLRHIYTKLRKEMTKNDK